jgi:hypothetical protein
LSGYGYTLPATAVCPGCGALVVLPAEPLFPDSPPAICATCDTEVPDYRRESYTPSAGLPPSPHQQRQPVPEPTPVAERRYSRGGLFRSLGGLLADRAEEAVESAKEKFTGQ